MNSLGCFYGLIIGNLLGSSYENFGKNGIENSIKNYQLVQKKRSWLHQKF